MTSRFPLLALASRNAIGRALGLPHRMAYSSAQIATAKTLYDVYRTRYDLMTSATILGCNEGECSFLINARGDHGEAGGIGQWHAARQQVIKTNTGIDVWTADAVNQARALMAEISGPWSAYRHVEAVLIAAPSVETKMFALLKEFEQSGNQARDLTRRVPMADAWLSYAKANWQ